MILRRLGNKQKIAKDIQEYFPPHKIYIEPFFGAGGMFFNKPKVKYNIVNDLDSDVFNLYRVVVDQKEELRNGYNDLPYHTDLLNYYKKNEETEPLKKALRFLFLSNFTLLGTGSQMSFGYRSCGKLKINDFTKALDFTYKNINDVQIMNYDFRKFLKSFQIRSKIEEHFIYCDPPYLKTNDNYSHSFKESDSLDLFNSLNDTGCKFAMSEFDNDFVLNQAKERGLNIIYIGERQNLKNRRTEILITNYANSQQSLF